MTTVQANVSDRESDYRAMQRGAEALRVATNLMEKEFLQTGDAIMGITDTSDDLVKASERLCALAVGQAGGESAVTGATSVLRAPLEFMEESGRRVNTVIDLLADYHGKLRNTLAWERDFRRIMQPLSYVQTLFRIEAARLEPGVATMLLDLVRDIEQLQQHVEEVFGEQFRELRTTHGTLGSLVTKLRTQAEVHTRTAERRRGEIASAIATLEGGVQSGAERDVSLGAISAKVGNELGRLVMALQFQDIISQKLEHVRATSDQIGEHLAGLTPEMDSDARGEALRFVEAAGKVMLSQLRAVEIEVGDADRAVDGSLGVIATCMRALDAACVAMHNVDVVSAGADGLVQVMLEALEQVSGLLAEGNDLADQARQAIEPMGGVAATVSSRMSRLAAGMNLVGLNAQVQAARVGVTGGLEVLSARTSAIAAETGRVSHSVTTDIDGLVAALGEVTTILAELSAEGGGFSAQLAAGGEAAEARLHEFRDQTLGGLTRVGELSGTLSTRLQPLLDRRSFSAVFASEMQVFRESVTEIVAAVTAEADALGANPDVSALTDAIKSQYTMASERRIHDAAIAGEESGPRRELRGGNVDMFDAFDDAPVMKDVTGGGGDAELWVA